MKSESRKNISLSPTNGFTLVETLVAISILIMVIIGPMTIAQRGIQSAYYANEQTTAIFLAQESMESIYRLRDNDALKVGFPAPDDTGTWDWYGEIELACKNATGCDVDYSQDSNGGTYRPCSGSNGCLLKQNLLASPAYGYDPAWSDNSPFTRKIFIQNGVGNNAKVIVTVSWESIIFKTNKSVTLQSWVYDHYRR